MLKMSIFIFQEKDINLIGEDLNKMAAGFVLTNYISLTPKRLFIHAHE